MSRTWLREGTLVYTLAPNDRHKLVNAFIVQVHYGFDVGENAASAEQLAERIRSLLETTEVDEPDPEDQD